MDKKIFCFYQDPKTTRWKRATKEMFDKAKVILPEFSNDIRTTEDLWETFKYQLEEENNKDAGKVFVHAIINNITTNICFGYGISCDKLNPKNDKLKLIIEPNTDRPCECEKFIINGIKADYRDFGHIFDNDSWNGCTTPDYNPEENGCGDNHFNTIYWDLNHHCWNEKALQGILKKYNISMDDYTEIYNILEYMLSIGFCMRCKDENYIYEEEDDF